MLTRGVLPSGVGPAGRRELRHGGQCSTNGRPGIIRLAGHRVREDDQVTVSSRSVRRRQATHIQPGGSLYRV
ncbi:MAG: hypothetical protein ACRDQZ_18625, partial [Mycobacteriales bacterium]